MASSGWLRNQVIGYLKGGDRRTTDEFSGQVQILAIFLFLCERLSLILSYTVDGCDKCAGGICESLATVTSGHGTKPPLLEGEKYAVIFHTYWSEP